MWEIFIKGHYPDIILAFNGRIFAKAMQGGGAVKAGHPMSDYRCGLRQPARSKQATP
ncbi:hypothetical protein LYNGBM3L_19340 [Moorena producens 3L]|uniref:Uncharacterized protein n=1 Tax=Moorena producens 3L TaxID=489825 RepID=F4XSS2_9CYAN|nr:hypothetical protein LYNGBM3L_19340 [Moorena producens 3L]